MECGLYQTHLAVLWTSKYLQCFSATLNTELRVHRPLFSMMHRLSSRNLFTLATTLNDN